MRKKIGILFIYLSGIALIIAYKEPILTWLSRDEPASLPLALGGAVLLALVPFVPYGLVAGILGAAYGPLWGGLIAIAASTAAAAVTFETVRILFRERSHAFLASNQRAQKFALLLERNAFLAVIGARLIPFVPAFAVTVCAAVIRMSSWRFVVATLIGKIPVLFLFVILGAQFA